VSVSVGIGIGVSVAAGCVVGVVVGLAIGVILGSDTDVCVTVAARGVILDKVRVTTMVLAATNAALDGTEVEGSDMVHPDTTIKTIIRNSLIVEKYLLSCIVLSPVISD
jgi:hypothetical protein